MKYLITGGAGFIGSHLAERLATAGNTVTILDDLSSGSLANIEGLLEAGTVRFTRGDVRDRELVVSLAKRCDQIFHLAAAVGVRRILANPLEGILTNVGGTESVLDAAASCGVPVLFASTSEVYGKADLTKLCETADSVFGSAVVSRWSYATSKKLDEYLALAYHEKFGLPVVVARLFNIVGPRQTAAYGSVLPNFINAALAAKPLQVFGDGMQTRNFTAVWDCVDAFIELISTSSAAGQVFNIGSPDEISIRHLAEKVIRLTGSNSAIELVPYNVAYGRGFEDMRSRRPCICKIKACTGWTPKVRLGQVIRRTAALERIPECSIAQIGLSA